MAEEQTPKTAQETAKTPAPKSPKAVDAAAKGAEATAAKPKKEKPPAPEEKPFETFIQQDFLPTLETALKKNGLADMTLSFQQQPLAVIGTQSPDTYWQVVGQWQQGQRQFTVVFTESDINSPKLFYYSDGGAKPSTIEQFMGDERKVTLDLMVLYTLQRLNGQKWLVRN